MKKYYVTNTRRRQNNRRLEFKGGAEQIVFDYTSWAEDNDDVTGVNITVEYGQAAISDEDLTNNVKSFLVTTSESGKSLIKLSATDGTSVDVQWLEIWAKDPSAIYVDDYGMVA